MNRLLLSKLRITITGDDGLKGSHEINLWTPLQLGKDQKNSAWAHFDDTSKFVMIKYENEVLLSYAIINTAGDILLSKPPSKFLLREPKDFEEYVENRKPAWTNTAPATEIYLVKPDSNGDTPDTRLLLISVAATK